MPAQGKMSARFKMLKANGSDTFSATGRRNQLDQIKGIDLAKGAIIGGAYEIIELIGVGGMGEVYLARHRSLGKKCALKIIPPEQVTDVAWLRFRQEAKAVANLDHVNLVRVTDLGIHDSCLPFYAMDYVNGKNLADILAESGKMPLSLVLEVFIQVCEGIDYAHRHGILHRDLKPANIMVMTLPGQKIVAKVLDFGLAKLTSHDREKQSLTAVGEVFGSPFYMSPEQCSGERLDRRSDIYSLGCTIFECLTGQPPFGGNLAAAIMFSHIEGQPPSLEDIVGPGFYPVNIEVVLAKLLRKNPVERYQTSLELRDDLLRVASGNDVQPYYVNRAKVSSADENLIGNTSGDLPMRADTSQGMSKFILALSVSVFAIISLGLVFVVIREDGIHKQFLGSPATKSVHPITLVKPQPLASLVKSMKPYSSIVKDRAGKKYLQFDFPRESIGEIVAEVPLEDSIMPISYHYVPCAGILRFPLGTPLRYRPNQICYNQPEYLDNFSPLDLHSIVIRGALGTKLPEAIFKHIVHLRGLKCVVVDGGIISDSKIFKILAELPDLTCLDLLYTETSLPELAGASFLQKLHLLAFSSTDKPTILLQKLKHSNIVALDLSRVGLSHFDYRLISEMQNIRTLVLYDCGTTNEDLKTISKMPHLANLNLTNNLLTLAALPVLTEMADGQLRKVNLRSTYASQRTFETFRASLPRLDFVQLPDPLEMELRKSRQTQEQLDEFMGK